MSYAGSTLAAGASASVNLTVANAKIGDSFQVNYKGYLRGANMYAEVVEIGKVRVSFINNTAASITISSGVIEVEVRL